ncbi:NAD(P)H-flavin oxidoreductase [Helicobacter fennelliae]|uniref:NAD(P)H-flavin oxidoreductase n=1 Tax=Helicobacter fennelliae TaxID=215 RepID=A0A2X3ERK8_9HELI|nr:nitroreductase family protein [Helicobacter fennelliae]SQC36365.1 NAD(P)H-flavin oxidoreductase [Helicobacter fennelliae]
MKFLDNDKIIEAFHFRHACKVFDGSKKLSEQDFRTILESARLSPSSFGFEPWNLLICAIKRCAKRSLRPLGADRTRSKTRANL